MTTKWYKTPWKSMRDYKRQQKTVKDYWAETIGLDKWLAFWTYRWNREEWQQQTYSAFHSIYAALKNIVIITLFSPVGNDNKTS